MAIFLSWEVGTTKMMLLIRKCFNNLIIRLQVPKLEGGNKARGQSQTAKLLDEWERRGNSNKISENVNQFKTNSRSKHPRFRGPY